MGNLRVGLPEVNLKDESKYQPAKLSDRERDGQSSGVKSIKFNEKDKVTSEYDNYQRLSGSDKPYGNFAEKNASISRLDMVGKNSANSGTAYNGKPIPETYKPATSEGVPNADAVVYKNIEKDRNA